MNSILNLCCVVLALTALASSESLAQDRGEQPTRVDLAATGGVIAGNLKQAQVQGRLHLSRSTKRSGFDLIGSAFRLWRPLEPGGTLTRVGDDQSLFALPFHYMGEKPYVLGLARLERIGLRQIENRMNGGMGMGVAPIREHNRLVRIAVGGLVERTEYQSEALDPSWAAGNNPRTVPRVFAVSNGWFRPTGSAVGGFYVGVFMLNPAEPKDVRGRIDSGLDVKVTRSVSIRLAANAVYEAVVPEGLLRTDLRSTVGLSWKTPPKSKQD